MASTNRRRVKANLGAEAQPERGAELKVIRWRGRANHAVDNFSIAPNRTERLDYRDRKWFLWAATVNDLIKTIPYHEPTSR
ncbi:MAG: hypothetical protein IT579_13610 [Verrucomicrobia subdivision 3 bacterium]|nr:hypothetical protein [Limisphaerales bacterium]